MVYLPLWCWGSFVLHLPSIVLQDLDTPDATRIREVERMLERKYSSSSRSDIIAVTISLSML